MPISEDIFEVYPDNWDEIRASILERSKSDLGGRLDEPIPCCEWCFRPNRKEVDVFDESGIWKKHYTRKKSEKEDSRQPPSYALYKIFVTNDPHKRSFEEHVIGDYDVDVDEDLAAFNLERLGSYSSVQTVLTVAHLCQDPRCDRKDHLRALCQRCHLGLDSKPSNREKRKRIKAEIRGQKALVPSGCRGDEEPINFPDVGE